MLYVLLSNESLGLSTLLLCDIIVLFYNSNGSGSVYSLKGQFTSIVPFKFNILFLLMQFDNVIIKLMNVHSHNGGTCTVAYNHIRHILLSNEYLKT